MKDSGPSLKVSFRSQPNFLLGKRLGYNFSLGRTVLALFGFVSVTSPWSAE